MQKHEEVKPKHQKGFSLGGRTAVEKVNNTPGPGAYNAQIFKKGTQAPQASFGARTKIEHFSDVPGPGTYSPQRQQSAPSFSVAGRV